LLNKLILIGDSGRIYFRDKRDVMIGIVSRISRNKHIILIDYDDTLINFIEQEYNKFKWKYKLPKGYVFRTSKGKKALVIFKLVPFKVYRSILADSDYCCINFRYYTIRSRVGTLRITKKWNKKTSCLELLKIVPSGLYLENNNIKKQFMELVSYESKSVRR